MLNIRNQIPSRVVFKKGMGLASSTTPLIKNNNAINIRIEKTTYVRTSPAPWAAVKKNRWLTLGISALFIVNLMPIKR